MNIPGNIGTFPEYSFNHGILQKEEHFFGIFLIFKESKQNHWFHFKKEIFFYKKMKYYLL